jgi:hypothetical protein
VVDVLRSRFDVARVMQSLSQSFLDATRLVFKGVLPRGMLARSMTLSARWTEMEEALSRGREMLSDVSFRF